MIQQDKELDAILQSLGGPLYYFGNRGLTLPDINGKMRPNPQWLQECFHLVRSNSKCKQFNRCFEPFAGTAAWTWVAIELGFSKEYFINDANKVLIDFFAFVKASPQVVKDEYCKLVDGYRISQSKEGFFVKIIEQYNSGDDRTKSLLIPFIINHSWGGMVFHDPQGNIIYRRRGAQECVTYGCLDESSISLENYCTEVDRISDLLNANQVHLSYGSFETSIKTANEEDFVILNPPYPENERSLEEKYGLYIEVDPPSDLHKKLCDWIDFLDRGNIAYFMPYGLYSPNAMHIIDHTGNTVDFCLKVIGGRECVFNEVLDRVYFSKKFFIPQELDEVFFPAREMTENYILNQSEVLGAISFKTNEVIN